jgi:hypothetical protein
MKTVTVFGVTMSLTAFIVALTGIILALAIVMAAPSIWPAGLVIMLIFFFGAYIVNCTVYGHCKVLAWILTVLYVINALTMFTLATTVKNYKPDLVPLKAPGTSARSSRR